MGSFQFSLRSLMGIVALAAAWAGLWAATPSWQCGLIQMPLFVIVPTSMAVFAARTNGYLRTFFLATLFVMLATAVSQCQYFYSFGPGSFADSFNPYSSPNSSNTNLSLLLLGFAQQKNATLFLWLVAFIAGAIAALTHRLLTSAMGPSRSSSRSPPQEPPP